MLLLMVEKCISGGICHHQYVGADNKYMKNDREKKKNHLLFKYWPVSMGSISIIPLGGFKWVEENSQFSENFIRS